MSGAVVRLRGWLWLCLAFVVVAVLSVISAAHPAPGRPLATANAGPRGGLALFTWLQRVGYGVSATGDARLGKDPARTVFLLAPQRELTPTEIARLRSRVQHGGRAVIATDGNAWATFAALGMPLAPADRAPVSVTQPLLLSPPTSNLSGQSAIVARSPLVSGSVAMTMFGSVLVLRRLGRGTLWLLTAPELLDNAHIGRSENRKLALNLAGPRGTRIDFLEIGPAAAPSAGGSGDWLTDTVWGAALLVLLGIALLYRWLGGWRLGPPRIPFRESRRPAVEYVVSLADLLRRARRRAEVLRVYQRTLRRLVVRRFGADDPGLLPEHLRAEVEPLLQPQGDLTEEELLHQVGRILECEKEVQSAHV